MFARLSLDHVVRGDLDCSGSRPSSVDVQRAPGPAARAASDSSATASPCPLTTAGWMPRATSRSSSSDGATSLLRLHRAAPSPRRRRRAARSSRPSSSDSATSRCCAPSCRLRSSRCRSCWPASMTRAREPCSSSSRARSSACSRPFSSAMPAAAADGVEQLGLVARATGRARAPRRVRRRDRSRVVARPSSGTGQRDGAAFDVGPAPVLGQPVGERQRGIAQRARERVAQVGRRRVRAQLDEQVADGRAGEPGVEQADQERDRREPDRRRTSRAGSSRTSCPLEARPASSRGRRSSRARARTSRPAARASAAAGGPFAASGRRARRSRPARRARARRAERRSSRSWPLRVSTASPSRLSGPKPPSSIPTSWRPNAVAYPAATSARSGRRSSRPLGNARKTWRKSAAGTRSKAMPIVYGSAGSPTEARQEDARSRRDHQRAEAALGPAPPGDEPREDVRQHHPVDERGLHPRLAHVIARERQRHRDSRCGAAGDRQRPQHGSLRQETSPWDEPTAPQTTRKPPLRPQSPVFSGGAAPGTLSESPTTRGTTNQDSHHPIRPRTVPRAGSPAGSKAQPRGPNGSLECYSIVRRPSSGGSPS